ncbi:MAG: hypothetical protein IKP77_05720 [Acholeplasmatales bacterium]|nr:hypothetical protein [Acholeplasmatales bacterium]MBR6288585.1 hypothetical protein [Acholeplasmatales bacterium]
MNEDRIKEDFIKAFGEEKWEIEQALAKIEPISRELAEFLEVPQIPIVVENIPEDSRMNFQLECIILRKDTALNYIEALKALAHEYRHWMQFLCVKNQDTSNPLVYEYAEGFMYMAKHGNANDGTLDYYSLIIEIDAFAFQKYFLKEVLEIETHYPDPGYDKILDKFIKKFY